MNIVIPAARPLSVIDEALIDAARRVQLSPTKHKQAEQHYLALCEYIDRPGNSLHCKVHECFASGSFGTGTVVASNVTKAEYDVDVVVELKILHTANPEETLQLLFEAINGKPGSRYYGKVKKNSRCVTVTYDDGVKVDLMPVARRPELPERCSNLFHSKNGEQYHKPVDPYDFREHFNQHVAEDRFFFEAVQKRAAQVNDSEYVVKADTEAMPAPIPLEQKSPLVAAIQLIKRHRDICYRRDSRKHLRKPPSVAINALALEVEDTKTAFVDVVIAVATKIRGRIVTADRMLDKIEVENPAWPRDIFTDRWPETRTSQQMYAEDLRNLIAGLTELKRADSEEEMHKILERLFGESVASFAVEKRFKTTDSKVSSGNVWVGAGGSLLVGGATSTKAVAVPRNTNFGEGSLPD
jgi:hypothetical protein